MVDSSPNTLRFIVTENMTLVTIEIILKSDFIFTLTDSKICIVPSSWCRTSLSDSIAAIYKNLKGLLSKKVKPDLLESALLDIENELVSRINEIIEYLFNVKKHTKNTIQDDEANRIKSKYLDDIFNLRKCFRQFQKVAMDNRKVIDLSV